jgi:hypothetical protein
MPAHLLLPRKIVTRHHDNRRTFVMMNDCFTSKATQNPRFRRGKTTVFQHKTAKMIQTLDELELGREEQWKKKVREKIMRV